MCSQGDLASGFMSFDELRVNAYNVLADTNETVKEAYDIQKKKKNVLQSFLSFFSKGKQSTSRMAF